MDVLIVMGMNVVYFYFVYIVLWVVMFFMFKGMDFFEMSVMFILFIILGKYLEVMVKGKILEVVVKLMDFVLDKVILFILDEEGDVVGEREIGVEFI